MDQFSQLAGTSRVPQYDKVGTALSAQDEAEYDRNKGFCGRCGVDLFKIKDAGTSVKIPLTNDNVHQGICIRCEPERVPKGVVTAWEQKQESFEILIGTIKAAGSDGDFPLHVACTDRPQSIDTIRSLVTACPEAIKAANLDVFLPLHVACANNAPLEVIQFLVEQWPESVMISAKKSKSDRDLPLHIACQNTAALEVVQYLVEQWPEAVTAAGCGGWLPLHDACARKAPLEVVQYLVEQWPGSIKAAYSNGRLPLHRAWHASLKHRSKSFGTWRHNGPKPSRRKTIVDIHLWTAIHGQRLFCFSRPWLSAQSLVKILACQFGPCQRQSKTIKYQVRSQQVLQESDRPRKIP
jgi:hypothetical protein